MALVTGFQKSDRQLIDNALLLLKVSTLILVAGAAISSRLFSVIRFESIIHEFDPWFNYRATKYLTENGFYKFLNWFDDRTWYPLGRVTGGTLYPGLMVTSNVIHTVLRWFSLPIDIRNICVMLAPAFSGLTAYVTYLFTTEMKNETAGLLAAIFMGIAPGYISRSVAGSYDNEAIAITLLMVTFYFWIKALKLGSALWGGLTALSYFYMVAAWGGYVFITNMIPLHVFVLLLMGRYHSRIYVAYSSWYAIGTLASMQIPFVGFLPIRSSDHMSALGVFGLLQLVAFSDWIRSQVPSKQFKNLIIVAVLSILAISFAGLIGLTSAGVIAPWTGRFYSLWDTNYAKIHIPIIASVSEHQPTAWPSFFFDNFMLIWLFPVGVYLCLRELADEHVFIIVYGVLASYFAGVMVRLMLTLTPIVCVAAGIAVSSLLDVYAEFAIVESDEAVESTVNKGGDVLEEIDVTSSGTSTPGVSSEEGSIFKTLLSSNNTIKPLLAKAVVLISFTSYLFLFVKHCTWVTSNAYSSPSVVLASNLPDGSQFLIDDFREAYYWLRMNTPEDAKIMSWWDYGYQIGGMADRTTLVDNNTWNNTHIATVGKAMSSSEEVAYPILRQHDVDYILVIFGGVIGFSGDDINKFLWMVRIAEGIWPEEVKERDFFTASNQYRVDHEATPTMRESMMYKMSYYRFTDAFGGRDGHDRVRGQNIPASMAPELTTIEEAFTSENWIVRIYKVKDLDNVGRDFPKAIKFDKGQTSKKKRSQTELRL
ncbi:dolichyl-diphosphooligosaccharide--protein glycosyltransferase subunit STT3 [Sugiyamaella lignohabitans]|uniref:Dolichyl-diphosphooligosaccharide--protein glycosyltransferase subunit STT3 n=1 Tax=Sugiyamaella lignohabitans TaxID=796027 RepID=A0A167FX26_9ASCO|nr:dolichyl-diphosphooligosaccharide--protein glycosyltransferase subunit STT3 [Sugiyamaella lignohabitans]ANB15811.1 dolichyl-diphosphooligosaccharide--protein glycosyltransferase subunit STT3 [Sugiyamaella lignohabitans]